MAPPRMHTLEKKMASVNSRPMKKESAVIRDMSVASGSM
jgi:hypothetical protein